METNEEIEEELNSEDEDIPEKNEPPPMSKEEKRLGGHKPLRTQFSLSAGPLMSQITGALYGIVTTIWVSKAVPNGMPAISTFNCFDGIGRAFWFFIGTAGSSKISSLIGLHKIEETGQIIADLIRVCIICGIIVPCILLPCLQASRPLVWCL